MNLLKKTYKDIIIFLIPFLIFIILLFSYYPGLITYDGINQWNQVQNGTINNAHPFFSTYFMLIISKFWNSPRAVLVFQIFIFSFFWSIICNKTRKNNYGRQVIYTFLISLIPIISMYSITLWKDVLYSYYLMMLAFLTYYFAKEKKYKMNIFDYICLGLLLFLIYSYRHNAIVAVVLYFIIFTILVLKNNKNSIKKLLIVYLTFGVLLFAISIPKSIYLEKEVKKKDEVAIGTVNQYITWIFGSYIQEEKISKNDLKFLDNIIDINYWKKRYNPFLINSTFKPDKINEKYMIKHQKKYQDLFIKYVLKNPEIFIKHYLNADSLLIGVNSIDYGYIYVYPFTEWKKGDYGFDKSINSKIPKIEEENTELINYTYDGILKYFYQPGLILYISLLITIYLCHKNKNKKYFLLLLPMFLNTLSLLPVNLAQDLRYVYINYLTLILLGLFVIQKEKRSDDMKNYTKPELKQKSKKNQKILLIIPAYNEEENILKTYKTIINYNKQNKTNYDVIVINDGSTDKTSEICFNNHIPTVNLIHNLGIGGAVQTGYKYAYENAYDIAIQYDGDGQHDVRYVKKIVEPILNGKADFVIGSRFVKKSDENFNSTFARRIGINIISFFIKLVSKKKIYDTTSGFRACNKAIIHEFAFEYPLEYPEPITTVELIKKGYRVSEVDVKMNERKGGTSSIKSWKNIYYMINVVLSILIIGSRRQK